MCVCVCVVCGHNGKTKPTILCSVMSWTTIALWVAVLVVWFLIQYFKNYWLVIIIVILYAPVFTYVLLMAFQNTLRFLILLISKNCNRILFKITISFCFLPTIEEATNHFPQIVIFWKIKNVLILKNQNMTCFVSGWWFYMELKHIA